MLKPIECEGCPLQHKGLGFSRPEGMGVNGVLVVGEALGREEYLCGTPFVKYAPAGSCLERAFELTGTNRQQYRLWNMVACQPPGNKLEWMPYEGEAIRHCKVYFDRVVQHTFKHVHTPVILALGNLPLRHLAGVSGSAKQKQSITHLRGYPLASTLYSKVVVLGGLHPAYIRRGNSNLLPALLDDLRKAVDIARGTWTDYQGGRDYQKPNYIPNPSYQDAQSFAYKVADNVNLALGIDIETSVSGQLEEDERESAQGVEIESVQFSLGEQSIYMPFTGVYIDIIRRLCKSKNVLLGFNIWNFDGPILAANHCPLGSLPHDLMWMFHAYQPGLQRNLQSVASFARFPFAWKHLYDTERQQYACADVHALQVIWQWLPGAMQKAGVWQGYQDHIYGYYPLLKRGSDVGIPVDKMELSKLATEVEHERAGAFKELEAVTPIEVRAVRPRRKHKDTGVVEWGYVRLPKQLQALVYKYRGLKAKYEGLGQKVVDFRTYASRCGYIARDGRWCKVEPLKTSREQLIRYIKWKRSQLERENEDL